MKSHPFLIHKDTSGNTLEPIDVGQGAYSESWLQELLRSHPDILPVAEIEPVFYPLIPIGREVTTKNGAIDNLFISHRGYPVLVETKLWRNPEAKRQVVAQTIDYASALSKWNYSRLDEAARAYTKRYEGAETSLVDWVEKQCGPFEGGRIFFEDTVAKNLRLGRFLTLIVGDQIRRSVVEMLDYVNKYPHLATDIVLMELQCYRWKRESEWPLLVVPSVVARTEIVERSVIQVTLHQDGSYAVDAQQEQARSAGVERKRVTLTEEAFWELLMEQSPPGYNEAKKLLDTYRERDGIILDPTESSMVARLNIQDTGRQASLFFIDTKGRLRVWPDTIEKQLSLAGYSRHLIDTYREQTRELLHMDKERREFARPIAEVSLDEFTAAVDDFIEQVEIADPINE